VLAGWWPCGYQEAGEPINGNSYSTAVQDPAKKPALSKKVTGELEMFFLFIFFYS